MLFYNILEAPKLSVCILTIHKEYIQKGTIHKPNVRKIVHFRSYCITLYNNHNLYRITNVVNIDTKSRL